ncbi:MAG: hypothetical protein L3K19_01540 [Thermoplasmata archaeon]|nr:hypothetical protein [Thermoplasmata archaeon]
MTTGAASSESPPANERLRQAEIALRRFGYAKIAAGRGAPGVEPAFWVQEPGVPRRTFPVFVQGPGPASAAWDEYIRGSPTARSPARAIVVVPTDVDAEDAYRLGRRSPSASGDAELSILVIPGQAPEAHWHSAVVERREVLRLATGVVVGLFQRAQQGEGGSQVDFEEMLQIIKERFRVDVAKSLGVETDEDALFLLYQLAVRDSYAPGDPGSSLHALVLRPSGPAARLPWFAA